MNLQNIHEGDVFKNYKELCTALDITTMGGNTKKSNLKKLAQHCNYDIKGREFHINQIYSSPLLRTPKNQDGTKRHYLFSPAIQQILLYELSHQDIDTTYEQLYKMLWFINDNYSNTNAKITFLSFHDNISHDEFNDIKQRINGKSKSLIRYALQSLQSKGAINYSQYYCITTIEGECRPATKEERNLYRSLETDLIYHSFHCKNLRDIYERGNAEKYYFLLSKKLASHGIKDVKMHVCITSTRKYFSSLTEKEILLLKQTINQDMKHFIHHQVKKEYCITSSQILQSFPTKASKIENLKITDTISDFLISRVA